MKERFSGEAIERICEGYDVEALDYYNLPFQVGFAAMGLLGMKRHPMGSADWLVHNSLYAESVRALSWMLDDMSLGTGPKASAVIEKIKAEIEKGDKECKQYEAHFTGWVKFRSKP